MVSQTDPAMSCSELSVPIPPIPCRTYADLGNKLLQHVATDVLFVSFKALAELLHDAQTVDLRGDALLWICLDVSCRDASL